jgi:hypothetical protein
MAAKKPAARKPVPPKKVVPAPRKAAQKSGSANAAEKRVMDKKKAEAKKNNVLTRQESMALGKGMRWSAQPYSSSSRVGFNGTKQFGATSVPTNRKITTSKPQLKKKK